MASVFTTMFQNYLLGATRTRPVPPFFVIRSNVLYLYSRRHVETVNIFCTISCGGFVRPRYNARLNAGVCRKGTGTWFNQTGCHAAKRREEKKCND